MFNGMKVFSATLGHERNALGERVTAWLTANLATVEVTELIVRQSSDSGHHCLSIIACYRAVAPIRVPR